MRPTCECTTTRDTFPPATWGQKSSPYCAFCRTAEAKPSSPHTSICAKPSPASLVPTSCRIPIALASEYQRGGKCPREDINHDRDHFLARRPREVTLDLPRRQSALPPYEVETRNRI